MASAAAPWGSRAWAQPGTAGWGGVAEIPRAVPSGIGRWRVAGRRHNSNRILNVSPLVFSVPTAVGARAWEAIWIPFDYGDLRSAHLRPKGMANPAGLEPAPGGRPRPRHPLVGGESVSLVEALMLEPHGTQKPLLLAGRRHSEGGLAQAFGRGWLSRMRLRRRRLKPKAALAPSRGRGPGVATTWTV